MNDMEKDIRKLRERRGGNGGYYDRVFETPAPGAKFPRPSAADRAAMARTREKYRAEKRQEAARVAEE